MFLDIDECVANTDDCASEAECKNTAGSFICTCYDGYKGNGKTCQGAEITKWHTLTLITYELNACLVQCFY